MNKDLKRFLLFQLGVCVFILLLMLIAVLVFGMEDKIIVALNELNDTINGWLTDAKV